jgi:hypothetical protein
MEEAVPIASYRSNQHPGQIPRRWAFALALIRPLTMCMLPLMIAALISVLQGFPVLQYLTIGFPLAIVIASLWTIFRMQASVAEIHVRPGSAAVVTVWRAVDAAPVLSWKPIYEIRTHAKEFSFGLGDASYELDRSDRPDADSLIHTLRQARNAPVTAL